MLNFFAVTGIALVLSGSAMAALMFWQGKASIHRLWAFFCISTVVWGVGAYNIATTSDVATAEMWWRITHIGVIFIPVLFLHFVYNFLGIKNKILIYGSYALGFIFLISDLVGNLFIANMRWVFDQFYYDSPPGILYIPFTVFFFTLVIFAHFKLYKAFKSSYGRRRSQIRIFFVGMLISFSGGGLSFLPVYNIDVYPALNLLASFYPAIISYAIIKHRLLNLRVIFRKSTLRVVNALFVGLYFGLAVLLIREVFESPFSAAALFAFFVLALIFVFLFDVFEPWFATYSSKYFFTGIYSYHDTLRSIGDKLTKVVSLKKIVNSLSQNIAQAMGVERVSFFLAHGTVFKRERVEGFDSNDQPLELDRNNMTSYLASHSGAIVDEELRLKIRDQSDSLVQKELSEVVQDMGSLGAMMIIPLNLRGELRGFIVLGEKVSRDAFTKEDIDLIEGVAKQAAIAIENARLYYGMEQEVGERTLELREANQRLEDLLEVKSEFLDIASHQLRTPTSIIRGMLSMVVDGSAGEKEKEFIRDSFQASERLTIIINDLLDATELEGKEMKVELKEVSLFELLEKSVKFFGKPAQTKGIDLIFKPAPNLRTSPVLRLDVDRFRSAIDNLIDNSIKYTREGSVTVTARQTPNQVYITVKDTGIGVHKDDLGKLFQKFSRGEDASKMAPNGSGLGLFIVKKIIEAHDGKIEASSPGRGEGTMFSITLPVMS